MSTTQTLLSNEIHSALHVVLYTRFFCWICVTIISNVGFIILLLKTPNCSGLCVDAMHSFLKLNAILLFNCDQFRLLQRTTIVQVISFLSFVFLYIPEMHFFCSSYLHVWRTDWKYKFTYKWNVPVCFTWANHFMHESTLQLIIVAHIVT